MEITYFHFIISMKFILQLHPQQDMESFKPLEAEAQEAEEIMELGQSFHMAEDWFFSPSLPITHPTPLPSVTES